ncbi:MAG TPA: M20/M25/M40 family metallo-hydrolase [Conexibacter sp.]|nr:M20/M25/M40 family metallo-hydrolase [Conexibacter sp.]
MSDLQQATVDLLQHLIRFDTVNPPGNERLLQELLLGELTGAGFECELLGAQPQRPNLIARLRGRADGPTLCLLGHVDTVLANPGEWTHDPWSGDVADGYLWGRGALDMKSQVAAEIAAAISLARTGWRPARGELLICSVVDEETGGELGAQWITENHPDKVRCDYLLNEGGGPYFEYAGARRYGVCCAEKGVFRFKLITDGVAGHASLPKMGDNALLKLGPLLERLGARQPSYAITDVPAAFLRGLGEDPDDPTGAVARLYEADARLATMFEPMLGVTFTPTRAAASQKVNVIPSRAEIHVDCRVPPGLGADEVHRAIVEVLGAPEDNGFAVEFTEQVVGNGSALDSPLREAIDGWIEANDPGAGTVPVILPGFTDSRWFRTAFPDCVAYGFFPHKHQALLDAAPLVHGADERIDVRDLGFAAQFYADMTRTLLG